MKFLTYDNGIFMDLANGLANKGKNQVRYFTPFHGTFPIYRDFAKGKDLDYLEKILYFWEHVDWADCIVNFDVGGNDAFGWLRDKFPEKSIFGSGWAQGLEDDRAKLKSFIKKMGLPMQNYEVIHGITDLRAYLKGNPNKYVKVNIFREDVESFYVKDYESAEIKIDQISDTLGPHKDDYEFVVEDCIDTDVEIGFDGFFNGLDYVFPCFLGYEYHKNLYAAKVIREFKELPPAIQETMNAFRPVLQKMDYRGALSTEEKIVSQKEHYFLDLCSRCPSPLSALYPEKIKNWAEAVYLIGKKQPVTLDIEDDYVTAISLESEEARTTYVKIDVKEKDRDKVKLIMATATDKGYYAVKGLAGVCTLIGGGKSVADGLQQLKDAAELVDADKLDKDIMNGVDVIHEIIEKGQSVGIDF